MEFIGSLAFGQTFSSRNDLLIRETRPCMVQCGIFEFTCFAMWNLGFAGRILIRSVDLVRG